MPCSGCGGNSLVRDDVTGNLVCAQCGIVQEFDNFDAQLGGLRGPQGTNVRVGSAGTGSALAYKEKKIFEAHKVINQLTTELGLVGSKSDEIRTLIHNITEGEFGQGNWFPVLVGACSYVVMRRDNRVVPMAEIAGVIRCDDHELGRMIKRVVEHLGLKLPEFDLVESFLRMVRNSPSLGRLERDKVDRIRKQGVFLLNCSVMWFLSTGRRPLPLLVAILVFVAELNGARLGIEQLAKEVQAVVWTCRKRYKELLEKLVKVAHESDLPWGKDITVKNIVKHAPHVISYMEAKAMKKRDAEKNKLDKIGFDLEDVISECLSKDVGYWDDDYRVDDESRYFDVGDKVGLLSGLHESETLKISHECLSMIYTKFANEVEVGNLTGDGGRDITRRSRRALDHHACRDWWNGKSDLSKKLFLKQLLEQDVGLDAMPPSYIKGGMAIERRREKINAAKLRIKKIMNPSDTDISNSCSSDTVNTGKKRRRMQISDIDWEDFIIETLLLHRVKEEEIEKGHYNTLLDLHVFNSGIV